MTRLFVDTNIVLDLLAKRKEFQAAAKLFVLADKGEVKLFVSALTAYFTLFDPPISLRFDPPVDNPRLSILRR